MWELKFKRKPKKEFKEKAAYVPQTEEHAPDLPKQLTTYHNRVSDVFNDYCHEMGVQCTIGMNPSDYNRQMQLKVVGDRDVQVTHRGKVTLLGPGESLVIKISDYDVLHGRVEEFLPQLTLLPVSIVSSSSTENSVKIKDEYTFDEVVEMRYELEDLGVLIDDLPGETTIADLVRMINRLRGRHSDE
jgi:hypothetical protein